MIVGLTLLGISVERLFFTIYTYLQVETCKDRIAAALETLRPITSWERSSGAAQGMDGVLMGGRGFGTAMEALFNYLGSEFGNTFALGMYKIYACMLILYVSPHQVCFAVGSVLLSLYKCS